MQHVVFAVLTVLGSAAPQAPQVTTFRTDDCKAGMEQVVRSYSLQQFVRSWSVKSMTADNGKLHLKVTCN
jgi:hypothetical protein